MTDALQRAKNLIAWEGTPEGVRGLCVDLVAEIERLRAQDEAWMTTVRKQEEELVRLRACAQDGLKEMEARKDAAYEERNKVVALLARVFPSGIAKTDIPGWSDDWHGCVYIDLPTGQVSWHYHDSQSALFAGLPPYTGSWDGHDTEEKYRRVAACAGNVLAALIKHAAPAPDTTPYTTRSE